MICGIELVKPHDFSLGDLSQNLCAQCKKPRVSQSRIKPWQDTATHRKFGQVRPPKENQIHAAYKEKLKRKGLKQSDINSELKKWHNNPE